jgi:hypothetical protein
VQRDTDFGGIVAKYVHWKKKKPNFENHWIIKHPFIKCTSFLNMQKVRLLLNLLKVCFIFFSSLMLNATVNVFFNDSLHSL